MNVIEPAVKADFEEVLEVWETSVRGSHGFLKESDILFYRKKIREEYLAAVDLYVVRRGGGIVAFIGLSCDMIEMLFVHPDAQRSGLGTFLMNFAVVRKGLRRVDVNEQNTGAVDFYLRMGFVVVGCDATDSAGRPFPVLHLKKDMGMAENV